MPIAVRQMTPIVARRGRGLVHVTSLSSPNKTACGKGCAGWIVAPANKKGLMPPVTCHACNLRIFRPCKDTAERCR
jgi:hypothetical protein